MADIINLRRARKNKLRAEAAAQASENRVRFGRSKAERSLSDTIDDLAARRLDGHRLAPDRDTDGEK
jgi:hypothetical protein